MPYDAVIFDLFGTLVDDLTHPESQRVEYERVMSETAAALSVPIDDLMRLWLEMGDRRMTGALPTTDDALAQICQQLGVQHKAEQISDAARVRFEHVRRSLKPRHDTIETLARLKASGYKVGLISDCTAETPTLWPDTPFAAAIEAPVFSCEVGLRKPDPRIYALACERLQVEPQRCVFVGDGGSKELTGASDAGMRAVLIRAPYDDDIGGGREEWQGDKVSSLGEILPLVT